MVHPVELESTTYRLKGDYSSKNWVMGAQKYGGVYETWTSDILHDRQAFLTTELILLIKNGARGRPQTFTSRVTKPVLFQLNYACTNLVLPTGFEPVSYDRKS